MTEQPRPMCRCGPDRAPCAGEIAVTGGSRCGGTGRSDRHLWPHSVRTGAAVYLRSQDRRGSVSPQTGSARQCISAVRTGAAVYLRSPDQHGSVSPQSGPARQRISAVRTSTAVYLRSPDQHGSVSLQSGPARQCISAVRTSTAVYLRRPDQHGSVSPQSVRQCIFLSVFCLF